MQLLPEHPQFFWRRHELSELLFFRVPFHSSYMRKTGLFDLFVNPSLANNSFRISASVFLTFWYVQWNLNIFFHIRWRIIQWALVQIVHLRQWQRPKSQDSPAPKGFSRYDRLFRRNHSRSTNFYLSLSPSLTVFLFNFFLFFIFNVYIALWRLLRVTALK